MNHPDPDLPAATRPLVAAFDRLGVAYFVGGSVASSAYGLPRTTLDVDLVADLKPEHVEPLVGLLEGEYYASAPMIAEALARRSSFNVIHLATMLKADVFLLKASAYDREALLRAQALSRVGQSEVLPFVLASAEALSSDAPHAYHWWGELETRPYMRARAGLAHVLAEQGRFHEAAAEYEALLALSPNDNQGVRYLIGPTYLLADDLDAALRAFDDYERAYPDDSGDPHHRFCRGLAHWLAGQGQEAVRTWARALFGNLYVAPLLLGEPLPPTDLWHGTNLAWPDYAEDYLDRYGSLWNRHEDARAMLRRLYHHPSVQERLRRWVEIGQALQRLSEARRREAADPADGQTRWRALVYEQWALRDASLPPDVLVHTATGRGTNGSTP